MKSTMVERQICFCSQCGAVMIQTVDGKGWLCTNCPNYNIVTDIHIDDELKFTEKTIIPEYGFVMHGGITDGQQTN